MSDDWVLIYTTDEMYKAEMARQYLSDYDIAAFIVNKKDSLYNFGDIEVLVKNHDVIKAKNLISKFESE